MARRDEGFFTAKDNTRLYWQSALPDGEPTDFVGIVHGYADHSERYRHTIDWLAAHGHGVLAFDYRGHGKADGRRGDCLTWEDFLDDLDAFWAKLKEMAGDKPVFLLAHSHGALMATHRVARQLPGLKGLVLSAPFYKLAFEPPGLKLFFGRIVKRIAGGIHMGNELDFAQLSRDEAWQKATAADPMYFRVTTPRWFFQTLDTQAALAGKGKDISLPVLMLAGGEDPIASMPAAKGFFETIASQDKTLKEYEGMRHEVLNELGKEQVLADINQWISAHR